MLHEGDVGGGVDEERAGLQWAVRAISKSGEWRGCTMEDMSAVLIVMCTNPTQWYIVFLERN